MGYILARDARPSPLGPRPPPEPSPTDAVPLARTLRRLREIRPPSRASQPACLPRPTPDRDVHLVLPRPGRYVTLTEETDEALLQRFQGGEAEAFEVLLGRYERPLFNFVLRSVRDPERAADLVQEVFLRVIQRSEQFQGNSKLSTWLYSIARNLCIDHGRRMVFRRHRSLDAPVSSEEGARTLGDQVAAETPEADRDAIAGRLRTEIARAVEALPEDQRDVFLMRQVQGLAFKEIAEVVGVPENTVKSRMRYALERLQEALADYADYLEELR